MNHYNIKVLKSIKFYCLFISILISLISAKTISEENDASFYFVYLPFLENIQNPSKSSNIKNEITKIIKDLDVEFIDFQDYVLYEINKPETLFPIINHGHYNSKGYKVLSGFLLKSLGTF